MFKIKKTNDYSQDIEFLFNGNCIFFDSYYFRLDEGDFTDFIDNFKNYINCSINSIMSLSESDSVFIPLDISDEYIGGIKASKKNSSLYLKYGYVKDIRGYIIRIENNLLVTNLNDRLFEIEDEQKIIESDLNNVFSINIQ